ncbi:MAG: Fe-S cluster assembly ATPase SufC [Epsilonproteobacteria bacterium]|nr:Fe-S cluster assembly ATPase SufC [Campylobacterota bacterium]NPA57434.1 Fe-S cluster assembly ATPase SufC [Campylobacterota bacterium]
MKKSMEIRDLHGEINGKEILKGIDLDLLEGKVHAVMGPNGAGKSTLSKAIVGHPDVEVTKGEIIYKGENIVGLEPEERALRGIFMAFQHPVEIPGVNNAYFLRTALNAKRKFLGLPPLNAAEFLRLLREKIRELGMKEEMIQRSLNEGFSGGEKKLNEILQMEILQPDFVILDEIDSGLDIDALKRVSDAVNKMRDGKRTFMIITHYRKILDYIEPDYVHILKGGQVLETGGIEIVDALEREGYKIFGEEQ